jgi:hypothetical protein
VPTAGEVFQVTVASFQLVPVVKRLPPEGELSVLPLPTVSRSEAAVMVVQPVSVTSNRSRKWSTGLLSATSLVAAPKLLVGAACST